jgi:hypothetical protein
MAQVRGAQLGTWANGPALLRARAARSGTKGARGPKGPNGVKVPLGSHRAPRGKKVYGLIS